MTILKTNSGKKHFVSLIGRAGEAIDIQVRNEDAAARLESALVRLLEEMSIEEIETEIETESD